jgi:hypothetical protein
MIRKFGIAAVVLAALLVAGCTDSELARINKSMLIYSTAVNELQKNIIAANQAKLIDDEKTGQIVLICKRAAEAGNQADAILKNLTELTSGQRRSLVDLLTPIGAALDPDRIAFIANIADLDKKQKIEGSIILVRSSISSIQIIIAVSGG